MKLSSVLIGILWVSIHSLSAPPALAQGVNTAHGTSFLEIDPLGKEGEDPRVQGISPPPSPSPGGGISQPNLVLSPIVISQMRIKKTGAIENLEVQFQGAQEWIIATPIVTLPQGTKIYTWAPSADALRWNQQGIVDDTEIRWLTENGNGAAGGGFYSSLSPIDSFDYGNQLIEQTLSSPVRMLNAPLFSLSPILEKENIQQLRALGIFGIRYQDTWINWIQNSNRALGNARIIERYSDIVPTLVAIRKTRPDLVEYSSLVNVMVRLNQKLAPGFSYFSELQKLGITRKVFENGLGIPDLNLPENQTMHDYQDVLHQIGAEMSPYIEKRAEEFRAAFESGLSAPLTPEKFGQIFIDKIDPSQIRPLEPLSVLLTELNILHQAKTPLPLFLQSAFREKIQWIANPAETSGLYDPFAENLKSALSFIDLPDLLLAMTDGNPAPWTLYDPKNEASPLLERWQTASTAGSGLSDSPLSVLLIETYKTVSERVQLSFRDHDIWTGGDLFPDAKGGFYRIHQSDLKNLQNNAFLTVESKSDPRSSPQNPTVLARHRYLSIQDYKKVVEFLPSDLLATLQKAETEKLFSDTASVAYKQLTRKFLEELTNSILKNYSTALAFNRFGRFTDAVMYRVLISIHPFADYNGRSIRALMAKLSSTPFFLKDWNDDLTASILELSNKLESGDSALKFIQEGLQREYERNPHFPRYYDIPEFYQVLAGVKTISGDPQKFVDRIKAYLRQPETRELIRQKRYNELRIPGACEQNLWHG